ncbi:MAG: hypothetical protein COA63_013945 [Methylophaga sp.]|nr:hypothetical protein [Methylophaga sp.]
MIFVFGSNLSGIHGAGAAEYAFANKGASWGQGEGLSGTSYALPTKGINIAHMPLEVIITHIDKFIRYAISKPTFDFKVTQVGCGLAGFTKEQIAPLFENAPNNCWFDPEWIKILPNRNYWV